MSENEPTEKRRSRRYACVLEAIFPSGERTAFHPVWPVRVLDISKHRLGLQAGEAIEVGALLTIKLYYAAERSLPRLQIRIVRATEQADATWIMGAEFIEPLSDEQLDLMLD